MNRNNLKFVANEIRARYKSLIKKRERFLNDAKIVATHICPERGRFFADINATLDSDGLNPKATKYLHNLASILQSGVTSPSRRWFKLEIDKKYLHEWGAVRDYLGKLEDIFEKIFKTTNFYNAIYSAYVELAAFGNVVMATVEDRSPTNYGLPTFITYTAGQWVIDQDEYGNIRTVYRAVNLSKDDIFNRFSHSPLFNAKAFERYDSSHSFKVIHAVDTRKGISPKSLSKYDMQYSSVWLLEDLEDGGNFGILDISGFNEMPYQVARWDAVADNPYGVGPGIRAIKDIKNLNTVEKMGIYGLNKAVNPPVLVPAFMNVKLNNAPGGITYYTGNAQSSQIKPLYTINPDMNIIFSFMSRWESSLKEIFQNDLFIYMLNRPNVTATEVIERNEEKLLLLGPILERIQSELLIPCFDRVYAILERNNLLPEAPVELLGSNIKPVFVGLLAEAHKQLSLNSVSNVVNFISALSGYSNEAIDKLNIDQAIDIYSTMQATPNGLIRSDEEVESIRNERADISNQSRRDSIEKGSIDSVLDYAKKVSSIDIDKLNKLNSVMRGV